jgi:hypothetical protein
MERRIEITLDEAKRVFRFLEKVQHLLHQPLYYRDPKMVEQFANDNYPEAKDLYYKIIWSWLPEDVRKEIEDE